MTQPVGVPQLVSRTTVPGRYRRSSGTVMSAGPNRKPPASRSRIAPKTLGESIRGRHSHSTLPLRRDEGRHLAVGQEGVVGDRRKRRGADRAGRVPGRRELQPWGLVLGAHQASRCGAPVSHPSPVRARGRRNRQPTSRRIVSRDGLSRLPDKRGCRGLARRPPHPPRCDPPAGAARALGVGRGDVPRGVRARSRIQLGCIRGARLARARVDCARVPLRPRHRVRPDRLLRPPASRSRSPDPAARSLGSSRPPSTPQGAMLVIHENRGLTDHIRSVAGAARRRRLHRAGGRPAVRGGRHRRARREGASRRRSRRAAGAPGRRHEGRARRARATRARAPSSASIGFCFGGGMVWTLLDARRAPSRGRGPVLRPGARPRPTSPATRRPCSASTPSSTRRVNASRDAAEAALEAAGLTYEIKTYPGVDHAFFNDTGGRYNARAGMRPPTPTSWPGSSDTWRPDWRSGTPARSNRYVQVVPQLAEPGLASVRGTVAFARPFEPRARTRPRGCLRTGIRLGRSAGSVRRSPGIRASSAGSASTPIG